MKMREILFRGKWIDNGEWVEGAFLNDRDGAFYICHAVSDISYGDGGNRRRIGCWYKVGPSTVGQFTGLTDKNGKRIFEGDVARCGTGRICKVTFFISPGASCFDLVPVGGFNSPPPRKWSLFSDTEVIGNIHDNPELLEAPDA